MTTAVAPEAGRSGRVQGFDLRVRATRRLGCAFPDHDAVDEQDTPDPRVRRGAATRARCELQGSIHGFVVAHPVLAFTDLGGP